MPRRKYIDKVKKLEVYRMCFNKKHSFLYFNLLEPQYLNWDKPLLADVENYIRVTLDFPSNSVMSCY